MPRGGVELFPRLADRQPAHRVARKVELHQLACAALAQRAIEPALHDRKAHGAARGAKRCGAPRPEARQADGFLDRLARRGQLDADVEQHGDVAADRFLKRDDVLGREAVLAAVEVRAEGDAVVVEPPPALQAEDLKAAGVGEDGAVPRHETVQAARCLDRFKARPQPEMIGVGEHDLRLRFAQFVRREAFDGRRGAHRHERRRLHASVRELQAAAPRPAVPR